MTTNGLRVLHVVNSGCRRGAEMFAADIIRSFNRLGVTQHVAVLDPAGLTVPFEAPITAMRQTGRTIPTLRVDIGRVMGLRRLIHQWNPDIIQGHGGDSLKYLTLAAWRSGRPIFHRSIGMAPPWVKAGMRKAAYRTMMRRTQVVAVAGEVAKEAVGLFGVPTERVHSVPNAVDPNRIVSSSRAEDVRRELGLSPADKVIISAGVLSWEKDPLAHLRVSKIVMQSESRTAHVFAGDGPLRDQLLDEARSMGIADRVMVLGSRADLTNILHASDVLLFASKGMEGMPGILIEAGMAGLPVAGYSIAGVDEVVMHGRTGLLASPGREDELAANVLKLFASGDLRAELGRAASIRCRELFDVDKIAGRYFELYRSWKIR